MNYVEFTEACGLAADKWWRDPATGKYVQRDMGEMLMLMVSDVSEGFEGERKSLMDDHLPKYRSLFVELADCAIRTFDVLHHQSVDAGLAFRSAVKLTSLSFVELSVQPTVGGRLLVIVSAIVDASVAWRRDQRDRMAGSWNPAELPRRLAHVILLIEHMFSLCGQSNAQMVEIIRMKLLYNEQRADHTNEARLGPNGKKW